MAQVSFHVRTIIHADIDHRTRSFRSNLSVPTATAAHDLANYLAAYHASGDNVSVMATACVKVMTYVGALNIALNDLPDVIDHLREAQVQATGGLPKVAKLKASNPYPDTRE